MFCGLGVLKYVACLCKGCDAYCVFVCILTRGAVGVRVCGSYQCCMTCSLLMLVDARGDHMEEAYSRAGLMTAL